MKRSSIRRYLFLFCFVTSLFGNAQTEPPFWNEIQAFKKSDSLNQLPENVILFVGSSSFRLWKNLDKAFPNHTILNRGFGGSSLPHVIQYANEIIFPYQPKQIIIYCGENDMTGEGVTGDTVFQRFKQLFTLVRSRLSNVPIVYVSMKPSPSRWHLRENVQKGNALIKAFLKKQKKASFVDVWKPMLDENGNPREELFVADKLHMNEKGYTIWTKRLKPYLLKTK